MYLIFKMVAKRFGPVLFHHLIISLNLIMKNIDNILKRYKWENRNKTKTKTRISRKPALGERGKNPKHSGLDTRGRLATDLHKAAKP